jgi:hypothetical protein
LTGDHKRATLWVSWLGQGLGGIFLLLGAAELRQGAVSTGFWLAAFGVFLAAAARDAPRTAPVPP